MREGSLKRMLAVGIIVLIAAVPLAAGSYGIEPCMTADEILSGYSETDIVEKLMIWSGDRTVELASCGDYSFYGNIAAVDMVEDEVSDILEPLGLEDLTDTVMRCTADVYPFDRVKGHPEAKDLKYVYVEDWTTFDEDIIDGAVWALLSKIDESGDISPDEDPFALFTHFLKEDRRVPARTLTGYRRSDLEKTLREAWAEIDRIRNGMWADAHMTPDEINEKYSDADIIQQMTMWLGERVLRTCMAGNYKVRYRLGAQDLAFGEVITIMTDLGKRDLSAMVMQYMDTAYPYYRVCNDYEAGDLTGDFAGLWMKASKQDRRDAVKATVDMLRSKRKCMWDDNTAESFTSFLLLDRDPQGLLTYSKQRLQRDLDFFDAQRKTSPLEYEQKGGKLDWWSTHTKEGMRKCFTDAEIIQRIAVWEGDQICSAYSIGGLDDESLIGAWVLSETEVRRLLKALGMEDLTEFTMKFIEMAYPFEKYDSEEPAFRNLVNAYTDRVVGQSGRYAKKCASDLYSWISNYSNIFNPDTEIISQFAENIRKDADWVLRCSKHQIERMLDVWRLTH